MVKYHRNNDTVPKKSLNFDSASLGTVSKITKAQAATKLLAPFFCQAVNYLVVGLHINWILHIGKLLIICLVI